MATVKAATRTIGGVLAWGAALAVVLAGQTPAPAQQDAQGRPPSVASVLQHARECYAHGDYEGAAVYYRQAQTSASELSPAERSDLDRLLRQNDLALKGRRDGREQLRQADAALRRNQLPQANTLLKALEANGYLSPADRHAVAQLRERLRAAGGAPPGPTPTPPSPQAKLPPNPDAKTALAAARAALQRGDLKTAEQLALYARQHDSSLMHLPWSDTPGKVLRDVDAARKQQAAEASGRPESSGPLQSVKNFLGLGSKATGGEQTADKSNTPPVPPSSGYNTTGAAAPTTARKDPAERARDTATAKQLIDDGYRALQKNDLTQARRLAEQAQALHPELKPGERSPDGLLADVRRRSAQILPTAFAEGPKDGSAVPPPPVPAGAASQGLTERQRKTQQATLLIREGRQALDKNDIEKARRLAEQAQALQPDLKFYEDNPEKLLRDIERRAPLRAAAPPPPKADAHALLQAARELYKRGKLDEAEKACARADMAPGAHWGLFDDTPDRLRRDIQQARTRGDREESARLLAEARRHFELGHLKEAKELAARAKQKHGPYAMLELGDRPDRLLDEIEMAEMKQRTVPVPPAPGAPVTPPVPPMPPPSMASGPGAAPLAGLAQGPAMPPAPSGLAPNNPLAPPAPAQPPVVQFTPVRPSAPGPDETQKLLARQRIQMLLQEAQALQRQDKLIEAQAKLVEAQEAAGKAVLLGVRLGPDESPNTVLGYLLEAGGLRVKALLTHADDLAAQGVANPRHLDEAAQELARARQLAVAFGQDLRPIDEKTARLAELQAIVAQGVPPIAAMPPGPVAQTPPAPTADDPSPGKRDGRRLLDDARRELRAGQLQQARRMAESAMDPNFGAADEAAALLRSIDNEERNQKIMASNHNADALRDAYNRGDFTQAAVLFRSLDLRDLSEDRRNHLKEILRTQPMQAALNGGEAPGRATASDLGQTPLGPLPGTAPGGAAVAQGQKGPNDLAQFRAREQVLFQKLREQSFDVQTQAMQKFKTGSTVEALELLREFIDRLDHAPMDADRVALLRRPVVDRLEKLSTLDAQERLENEARLASHSGTSKEAIRALTQKRKQETVADLMRRYDGLYKDSKYDQCMVVLAEARDIDPENASVNYAYQLTKMKQRLKFNAEQKEQKEDAFLKWLDPNQGPAVDIGNPMAFDPKMQDRLSHRKPTPGSISFPPHDDKERMLEQRLLEPTTVSFNNTPLQKVIDDLSVMHNLNIVPDKAALDDHSVSLDFPLSLKVSGISLKSALNLLLHQAHLTYVVKDQVLQITTEDNAAGRMKQVIYPVTDLVVPVENHAPPAVSDLTGILERFNDSQMQGPRGVTAYIPRGGLVPGQTLGSQEANNMGAFASTPGQVQKDVKYQRISNTMEENLIQLITTTVAPDKWSETGGKGTIRYYPLGQGLIVNQTQDVQEQVADLLAALRRLQDLEVAIEIRLVSVSESFFERMGLDFNLNIVTPTSSVEPLLTTGNFTPFPFVNRFTPQKFGPVGLTPAGTFTPDLNIPIKSSSFDFATPPFGGYPGTLGADGGLTLGLAFLSDIQVFMLLEAAQGDRRTNTMQAPRVTVFNGQQAFISVNTFEFFLIGVNINTAADQIFFTPQNQAVPLGVQLTVTPVVTADRRFVRLSLNPTLTNLSSANVPLIPVQIPVPQTFQDGFVGPQPVIFQMFFQQPTFDTIQVNTTVLVPDGGTVLLGGLKTASEGRNEFGPPILSKIPYLKRLFTNIGYGREARSLMIMVTPRIIINEEEENIFLGTVPPLPRP